MKCDVVSCGKAFRYPNTLKLHKMIHTQELPYMCLVENCGKAFRHAATLKVHTRTHTGERPYVCDVLCSGVKCGKAFLSSSHRIRHKKTVHRARRV